MLEIVLIALAVIIGGILVAASRKPGEFRVVRSILLKAPPAAAFEHVNDLEKWQAWSPWAKMEPLAKTEFSGPKAGKDAVFKWTGKKTGQGCMTIVESRPGEFIRFRLEFLKPMKAVNTAEFKFDSEGPQTRVTWTMFGVNKFMNKVVSLFMNCDKMVGGQFEQGLSSLKEIVEKEPRKAA